METELEEKQKLIETLDLVKQNLENMKRLYDKLDENVPDDYVFNNLSKLYSTKIKNLEKSLLNPYFARIDFRENNNDGTNNYYIGKATIYNDDDNNIAVVDWRAPLSSMYYEYAIGEASYTCPEGIITGELTLKRNYQIENGVLANFQDIDITSNDELLQEFLSVNADVRLKNIVATIQSEQDKIIRADMSRPLIVQGVAGSGKTTVALHRIAYLLYTYEKTLKPEEFLIIAPNRLFLDYISNVLPDLGVEYVRQETYEDFAQTIINAKFTIVSPNKLLTQIVNASGTDQQSSHILRETAKFKTSFMMKQVIDGYLEELNNTFLPRQDFMVGKYKVLEYKVLRETFMDLSERLSVFQRVNRLKRFMLNWMENKSESIADQIAQDRKDEVAKISFRQDSDEFNKKKIEIYNETNTILQELRKGGKKFVIDYIKKLKILTVLEHYKKIFEDKKIVTELFKEDYISAMCDTTNKSVKKKSVEYEDLPALMYLQYKVYGLDEKFSLRHIVIDEAQDFGEFSFYVLQLILGCKSMTILGDIAQGIYSYRGISNWDRLNEVIFNGEANIEKLQKSYRTTIEIMNEANKVLSKMKPVLDVELALPVIRHGDGVKYLETGNFNNTLSIIKNRINEFKNDGYDNIAVIAKTDEKCNLIYNHLLENNFDLNILSSGSSTYKGGINIIPAYLSKGLEFDAVMLVDADDTSYTCNDLDAKILYVSMTRAMHSLDIYYEGVLTGLLN
ncbi:MAG: AAA family ATPase [Clostridiales bacterium]|jgi:DNA helicase-2/ATP-dependent DNA helicase PcrA|nr:AAA family ATPase [Clostridiales bacterium]